MNKNLKLALIIVGSTLGILFLIGLIVGLLTGFETDSEPPKKETTAVEASEAEESQSEPIIWPVDESSPEPESEPEPLTPTPESEPRTPPNPVEETPVEPAPAPQPQPPSDPKPPPEPNSQQEPNPLIAPEVDKVYTRSEWGDHKSQICKPPPAEDPYTGLTITSCDVDHIVALSEANESGGWEWTKAKKQQFSQDPENHVATLACVNRSKGSKDPHEWLKGSIPYRNTTACGDGYVVNQVGACLLAKRTKIIKIKYELSFDQAEYDAIEAIVNTC